VSIKISAPLVTQRCVATIIGVVSDVPNAKGKAMNEIMEIAAVIISGVVVGFVWGCIAAHCGWKKFW
jgi:hypothetical protein